MKQTGRNIKKRLYAFTLLRNRLLRAKYYRGYRVHSPFVYMLVRKAFMSRAIAEGEPSALYEALLRRDVARRRAVQLQKAFDYCAAERFCIDEAEGDFRVLTEAFATADLQAAFDAAHEADAILVVMKPYADRERQLACRSLIQMHDSTSVDNRAYLIIFNSNKLPKQHFRL